MRVRYYDTIIGQNHETNADNNNNNKKKFNNQSPQ